MLINNKSYYGLINNLDEKDERIPKYLKMYEKEGFDPTETWNLDETIAKFICPRLKYLKDHKQGYPMGLSEKRWNNILDKMIYAFDDYENKKNDKDEYKKVEQGLKLFAKYYFNLWD